MSRASISARFTPTGGSTPRVQRANGECLIELSGAPFKVLELALTDEQARRLRDTLCSAYGEPEAVKRRIRQAEAPARPMPRERLDAFSRAVLKALPSGVAMDAAEVAQRVEGPCTPGVARAHLSMLANAGLVEVQAQKRGRGETVRRWSRLG